MATQRRMLTGPVMTLTVIALFAAATWRRRHHRPPERPGAATVTTEKMSGEVVQVNGNNLVVKMSNGELRTFNNMPDSRRATIDGKEVGVRDLKPGTKLTATITRTTTPVTVRTTTVGTGRVRFVAGNTVILTLPNGENKQYTVRPDYKFIVNGRPATVTELRPGMTVSAEKIVEEPTVEIAMDTTVVGQGPRPQVPRQQRACRRQAAPAARRGVGGRSTAAAQSSAQAPPARLPRTGSPVPLVGLLGLLLVGGSSAMRRLRRA